MNFGWPLCIGMLVLMCWHVDPGIGEVPTQAGLSYCLVFFFLYFLKVKFRGNSAMLVSFPIYCEFWLVLVCFHVGPDVMACWSLN